MDWLVITFLAVATFLLRTIGYVSANARHWPDPVTRVVDGIPVALIGALVVVGALGGPNGIVIDARLAGLMVALIAAVLRAPMLVIFVVGVAGTATARGLGL